jgi:hypothetical protein
MIRFASLRSTTSPDDFRTPRCREIDGALMVKRDAISPAPSSPACKSWRICRRVGSARALNTPASSSIFAILANVLMTNQYLRRTSLTGYRTTPALSNVGACQALTTHERAGPAGRLLLHWRPGVHSSQDPWCVRVSLRVVRHLEPSFTRD